MTEWQALLLGIVQGLTEPLPVSSSGHLVLVPWIGEFTYLRDHPEFNHTFDVALHLGTLVGVIIYFRHEFAMMLRGAWAIVTRNSANIAAEDRQLTWMMVLGTLPAVVVGAMGEKYIESDLGEPWQIGVLLIVFGALLAFADRLPERRKLDSMTLPDALLVGFAQALALAPGVSRSGVTITAGRALGLDRDAAARFAFLLLIPSTAGAVVYKGAEVAVDGLPPGVVGPMLVGIVAAGVSGYAAIAGLLRFVRSRSYDVFVAYRFIVAGIVFVLIAAGVRSAEF